MPDQPQQGTQYGPFTAAITGPLTAQPEQAPATYAPSKAGAVASYANAFLRGAQTARRERYERSEQKKMEDERNFDATFAHIQSDPNISKEGKDAAQQAYLKAKYSRVNEDLKKAGKDHKDNPLYNLTKSITSAVLGPSENKAHKDLGIDVNTLLTIATDPKFKIGGDFGSIASVTNAASSISGPNPGAGAKPGQTPSQPGSASQGRPSLPGYEPRTGAVTGNQPAQPTPPPPGTTPAAAQVPQGGIPWRTQEEALADPKYTQFLDQAQKKGVDPASTPIGYAVAQLPKAAPLAAPKGVTAAIMTPDGKVERYVNALRDPSGQLLDPNTQKVIPNAVETTAGFASQERAQNPTTPTLQKVWIKRPGSENPEYAFVNPKNPSGYEDVNGKPIEGAVPTATPTEGSGMGRIFADMAVSQLKKEGVASPSADQVKARAGDLAVDYYGSAVARRQQEAAIDEALSHIPLGTGLGGKRTPPPGASGGETNGGETKKTATKAPPIAKPAESTERAAASTVTPAEENDADYYMGTVTGTQKSGGKAAQVKAQRGEQILRQRTGLSPTDLNIAITDYQATKKALTDAVQTANAYTRVQSMLEQHGKVLQDAATELKDKTYALGDAPLKNATVQWFDSNVGPHPELQKYREAIQAVSNEYARLISGGVQSRAQLPISASARGEAIISPSMTMQDVVAAVDQLKTEAAASQKGFANQQNQLKQRMGDNPISKAFRPSASEKQSNVDPSIKQMKNKDGAVLKIGDPITGPDGKTYTIQGFGKDGSVDAK